MKRFQDHLNETEIKSLNDNALVEARGAVHEELEKVNRYLENAKYNPSTKKQKEGEALKKELDLLEEECEKRISSLDEKRDEIIDNLNDLDQKIYKLRYGYLE